MPRKFATDLDAELMREIRTSTHGGGHDVDEETRGIMEAQSERLYGETKAVLARLKLLTERLWASSWKRAR